LLLFRSPLKPLICSGSKTQTRRNWKSARAKAGQVHACYTRPPYFKGDPFAYVLVTRVWRHRLTEIDDAEIRAEGFDDRSAFFAFLGKTVVGELPEWVYAVSFELVACVLPGKGRIAELEAFLLPQGTKDK